MSHVLAACSRATSWSGTKPSSIGPTCSAVLSSPSPVPGHHGPVQGAGTWPKRVMDMALVLLYRRCQSGLHVGHYPGLLRAPALGHGWVRGRFSPPNPCSRRRCPPTRVPSVRWSPFRLAMRRLARVNPCRLVGQTPLPTDERPRGPSPLEEARSDDLALHGNASDV